MGEMKSDMGGAAAVLGMIAAVATVRPDVEVHAIVAAAENMPDAAAYRPADIFTSLDGKTVEIINTDAEGRLVLADALTYADAPQARHHRRCGHAHGRGPRRPGQDLLRLLCDRRRTRARFGACCSQRRRNSFGACR